MNKAIFLDRDGVINKEKNFVFRVEEFEINKDVVQSVKILQQKGYIFIVITNQSGIAKGLYTHSDVEKVHRYMNDYFSGCGIIIKDIFYCPHHDDTGKCLCRKPNSLMIEKAMAKYDIDARKSFLIGDKQRDIEAAERAGVKGFLIQPDESILKIAEQLN